MGLSIRVANGSGRARCVICDELIEKGELNQVECSGYQTSARCHRSCIVHWEKIKILKGLEDE